VGYRVGIQCVETKLQADDLVLSTQSPLLSADGQVYRPIRVQDGWYYQGNKITLSYPECNPVEQMKAGAEIGGYVLTVFVIAYCFKLAINLITSLSKITGDSSDN
jgi:hypothetical protein